MTAPPPGEEPDASERELLDWLEEYEDALAHGRTASFPADLLARFERLPRWVECLNHLQSLAISDAPPPPGPEEAEQAMSPSSWSQLPRQFGGYELIEELGRGGMGVVYRARHRKLDSFFALKLIRTSEFASGDEVRRFFQEAQTAARLSHPNIVGVHDAGEQEGLPFLVMRYISGETLAQRIRRERPTCTAAAEMLVPIARAVHYLHSQGIVHRDLKPANILLDTAGVPHVTDFGLAKVFSENHEHTATGTVIGTPAYMAPEQAWGKTNLAAPACDVYSLGAILYELLTGQTPFPDANPLDQILRLRDSEPRPPHAVNPEVPGELEQICLRCLEKQPEMRYRTADELADDLQRYLSDEPLQVRPIGLWRRLRRWMRREPALATHLAGLLIMALIVQIRHWLPGPVPDSYGPVMTVLGVWGVLAAVMQKLLLRGRLEIRLVWVAVDAVLFTAALCFAQPPVESLILGYPLLIAASGLWYQPAVVLLMTLAAAGSYLVLFALRGAEATPIHYPFIVTGMLTVVGGIVFALVRRIRQLLDVKIPG